MAESLALTRPNLRYCSKPQTEGYNNSASKAPEASFRSYMNVPIPVHRTTLVRLLTSSRTLAVDVLQWLCGTVTGS